MHKRTLAVLAAVLAMAHPALAETGSSQPAPSAPASSNSTDGSVYVRCDGFPPHHSAAEIAARIVLIMATAGLAGPGELADTSKRLSGAEGVAACDAAIANETDPTRKMQLTLARAIHHIEAKDYAAALADASAAPSLAGGDAGTLEFRHSLLLSALELQAAALVRLDRPAEAERAAIEMAAASPYDLITQERAARYVGLTADLFPEKKEYLDRLARLWPEGLMVDANADEWAGDYAAAAADAAALIDLDAGFATNDSDAISPPAINARHAVDLALAGDMKDSDAVAADTQKSIDDLVKSGKSLNMQHAIDEAEELLDFQTIVAEIEAGKIAQARAAFTARARWLTPTPAAIADITAKLRKNAKPGELSGVLMKDPATIRTDGLAARMGAIVEAVNADKDLYAAMRSPMSSREYSYWNDDIRETDDSPFLVKKTGKEKYTGDLVFMKRANGIAAGDALMMHCALLARARGKAGFVIFAVRPRLDTAVVRFGNPGDPGIPSRALNDAATIVTALSQEFPDPNAPAKAN